MISVEFKSVRAGTCAWCRREKDQVYDVAFSDKSFVGPLCKVDLLRAVGLKLPMEAKPEARPGLASATAVPVGNGPAAR